MPRPTRNSASARSRGTVIAFAKTGSRPSNSPARRPLFSASDVCESRRIASRNSSVIA
jgi:hypothetical protein